MPFATTTAASGPRARLAVAPARALPLKTAGPRQRDLRSEGGQAMVELTLIAPVLFAILFAIVQYGIVYRDYVTLTDATRVGARKAAVSRYSSTPGADAEAALRGSAANLVQGDLEISISAPAWEHGQDVTVEASYPYEVDLLGLVVASGNFTSKTTERVE